MGILKDLTEAQENALHWLRERGGSGVIHRYGAVMAGGELASKIAAETWLRLLAAGRIEGRDGRISVTGRVA